jgi:hypothetical protein
MVKGMDLLCKAAAAHFRHNCIGDHYYLSIQNWHIWSRSRRGKLNFGISLFGFVPNQQRSFADLFLLHGAPDI